MKVVLFHMNETLKSLNYSDNTLKVHYVVFGKIFFMPKQT